MNKLPILEIQPLQGVVDRFFIQNDKGEVWNGIEFVSKGRSKLFADFQDAAVETQVILKKLFDGHGSVKFVVPVFVEVFSNGMVYPEDIANYLSNACRLQVNTHEHGHGPQDSLVTTKIDWGRIEQMKEFPDE